MLRRRDRNAELEHTGQLVEDFRKALTETGVNRYTPPEGGPSGWLKSPPTMWDDAAHDAALYQAMTRFMEIASHHAEGPASADPDWAPASPEDAGMILKDIVAGWVDAFVSETPEW